MIAALFVEKDGVYSGLPDVDVWDESRDARLYDGPWPVVAHPPCARWCQLAPLVEHVYGYKRGEDGGCFEAALRAVRTYGGVLEHPAYTLAWKTYGLPKPIPELWRAALDDDGWVIEFYQHAYGTPARKATWLYAVGVALPELRTFGRRPATPGAGWCVGGKRPTAASGRMRDATASRTPEPLRDTLLTMARSAAFASPNPRPSLPARQDLTPEPDPAHPRNLEPTRNRVEAAGVDGLTALEEEDAPSS